MVNGRENVRLRFIEPINTNCMQFMWNKKRPHRSETYVHYEHFAWMAWLSIECIRQNTRHTKSININSTYWPTHHYHRRHCRCRGWQWFAPWFSLWPAHIRTMAMAQWYSAHSSHWHSIKFLHLFLHLEQNCLAFVLKRLQCEIF